MCLLFSQIPCGFSSVKLLDNVLLNLTAVVCDPGDFYDLIQVRRGEWPLAG